MNDARFRRRSKQHRPPTTRQPTNARDLAFAVLDEFKQSTSFVSPLIDRRATESGIAANDRRLASEIIFGVIRRQATLNALIEPHVTRPRHKIEGALWTLLQVGTHQLAFMNSIPPHAALHETVEVARRLGKPRWCGFLNGVLRAVEKSLTDQRVEEPASDAVPISAGQYRKCRVDVFPDPTSDASGYFARAFSFPDSLATRWQRRYEFAELCRLGFWFNSPPRITLRVNTLKTTRGELLDALTHAEIDAQAGTLDEALLLASSTRIDILPGFVEGWFAVQDESAMQAARLLDARPGVCVLDLCAAPGTKTTHLAQLMNNEGTIIATDVRSDRLERIEQNCRRLGTEIIAPRLIQNDGSDLPDGPFDAILVDVPCSNSGVLAKRPEARWRIDQNDLDELSGLQRRLLARASKRVKPGGRIVYSTCSIEPEENQQVVEATLKDHPEIELIEQIEHIPGQPGDGGFQALLRRTDKFSD